MVPPWLPPAHECPAALAGWKSTWGCPRVPPVVPPSSWHCREHPSSGWHHPQGCLSCHAAQLCSELAGRGGGIFHELGRNSQQLLYRPEETGESWGWDTAWPSPGQTSARGRPWATHECKELKKQIARCKWVFPLLVLCSQPGACLAVPRVPIREAMPLAAGFSG